MAKGRGKKSTTEMNEKRNMTAVAKGGEEKGVKTVTEGSREMKTAHLMMAARTLQRLLVREAEEGSHTRERRELVKRKGESSLIFTHCKMIRCPGTSVLSV